MGFVGYVFDLFTTRPAARDLRAQRATERRRGVEGLFESVLSNKHKQSFKLSALRAAKAIDNGRDR